MSTARSELTTCNTTMKLLSDYWTLKVIDSLKHQELRFCELQRTLGGLNPVTLTNRLKKLEQSKLVKRSESTQDKISVSYTLTNLGREVLPIIQLLDRFAAKLNS